MKYIVALEVGVSVGIPQFEYQQAQVIEAETPEEAVDIYNTKNNCDYFYGRVVGRVSGEWAVAGSGIWGDEVQWKPIIRPEQLFIDRVFRKMGISKKDLE